MTTASKKTEAPKAEVKTDVIAPAVAVHSIVVGKDERIQPGAFYTAKSQAERDELVALGAIREFDDEAELALYEKIEASKKDVDPADALG